MVFSEILYKIPYSIGWRIANSRNYSFPIVFYCSDLIDYILAAPILKHLPEITIAARNRMVQDELAEIEVSSIILPAFPNVVIMARHAFHKFPSSKVKKIGIRHGAYNFKGFIDSKKYNRFDLFLFTSSTENNEAEELGIKIGKSVGFPKIDALHDGSIKPDQIENLKTKLKLDTKKSTILFSATWDKSGYSALEKWYDKIGNLSNEFNVLVTLHSQVSSNYRQTIKGDTSIHFIEDKNINPYLLIADVLISDTSSIIAEFCSLNKPIITFKMSAEGRLKSKIVKMLDEISFRVDSFNELEEKITFALENKNLHSTQRENYNKIFFDKLDGSSGKRAAEEILKFLKVHQITF